MTPLASYLLETLVTLGVICALAVLALYAARRAGIARPLGPMHLVGRLPLDGRRAIYLVRVGKSLFVVGASEQGLNKLGELPADGLELATLEAGPRSFREALARAIGARAREAAPHPDAT